MSTTSSIEVIQTENAPAAIGTYSQAVAFQNIVFISGQVPLDPHSGEVVSENFEAQAHQVFKNLVAVANAAGSNLSQALKLGVFLTDLANFNTLNQVMSQYIQEPYPARAAVQVSALPKNVLIEIDAIVAKL